MSDVKQWCVLISTTAIISGVLLSVIPSGKLKNVYNTLVSILLIYSILLPLISEDKFDFDFSSYLGQNEAVSESFQKSSYLPAKGVASAEIEKSIEQHLKTNGIDIKCRVECSITKDSFGIDEISIEILSSGADKSKIEALLKDYVTESTKIVFVGDKNE